MQPVSHYFVIVRKDMINLYEQSLKEIKMIRARYGDIEQDGLTWKELIQFAGDITGSLMRIVQHITDSSFSGEAKKQMVLDALGKFYDNIIAPINITYVPDWIESYVDKSLREPFLELCESLIEIIYGQFMIDVQIQKHELPIDNTTIGTAGSDVVLYQTAAVAFA